MSVKAEKGATEVFNSSKIPGEIQDLMVVNTQTLKDNPNLGKALVGIWYETIALMKDTGEEGKAARTAMAEASGSDLAGFEAQLATTKMFYTPKEALDFTNSADVPKISDLVRTFSFDHALLGDNVKSKDAIGIAMPDGKVQGAATSVKLRYDTTFMKMALDNKL
jgi:NitT/TauT family transport system substrate-binding protein